MDLPTYTSIWRIEKRLYKLYDFRLPMPLPIGQVTVFVAIAVPYLVLLTMLGVPFNHTLIWIYILPPGLATWLVTRPVLESKRLPELIKSQLRYLAEPKVLCRMSPLSERDVVVVTGRIWRPRAGRKAARREFTEAPEFSEFSEFAEAPAFLSPSGEPAARPGREPDEAEVPARPGRRRLGRGRRSRGAETPAMEPAAGGGLAAEGELAAVWEAAVDRELAAGREPAAAAGLEPTRVTAGGRTGPPSAWASGPPPPPATPPAQRPAWPTVTPPGRLVARAPVHAHSAAAHPAAAHPADHQQRVPVTAADLPARGAPAGPPGQAAPGAEHETDTRAPAGTPPQRPAVTVVTTGAAQSGPPSVERALAGPAARRGDVRAGRVTVVPGGHRPGKPDLLQRDRARAQLPVGRPARVVVLGCTVGAGQTMTTLLTGEVLASLRAGQVTVLDFNPGPGGLAGRAEVRPALSQAAMLAPSRLVIGSPQRSPAGAASGEVGDLQGQADQAADAAAFATAADRYELVLADPATASVPKLLPMAAQLILVAPASAAAPGAIAMTFEWLEAHGHGGLAAGAIMVLNGVSRRSLANVEQSERVCAGRCRAIVRVPWDDQLQNHPSKRTPPPVPGAKARQHWAGLLTPATAGAYTALAGVLVASLAEQAGGGRDRQAAPVGQARR